VTVADDRRRLDQQLQVQMGSMMLVDCQRLKVRLQLRLCVDRRMGRAKGLQAEDLMACKHCAVGEQRCLASGDMVSVSAELAKRVLQQPGTALPSSRPPRGCCRPSCPGHARERAEKRGRGGGSSHDPRYCSMSCRKETDKIRARISYLRKRGRMQEAEALRHELDEWAVSVGWPMREGTEPRSAPSGQGEAGGGARSRVGAACVIVIGTLPEELKDMVEQLQRRVGSSVAGGEG